MPVVQPNQTRCPVQYELNGFAVKAIADAEREAAERTKEDPKSIQAAARRPPPPLSPAHLPGIGFNRQQAGKASAAERADEIVPDAVKKGEQPGGEQPGGVDTEFEGDTEFRYSVIILEKD